MTEIPARWRDFAQRRLEAMTNADAELIRWCSENLAEDRQIEIQCASGHRIIRMTLGLARSGRVQLFPPSTAPYTEDGTTVLYDVITGPIDDSTTVDYRMRFTCSASKHGKRKPLYVRRYSALLADAVRAAMRDQSHLILGDTRQSPRLSDPDMPQ